MDANADIPNQSIFKITTPNGEGTIQMILVLNPSALFNLYAIPMHDKKLISELEGSELLAVLERRGAVRSDVLLNGKVIYGWENHAKNGTLLSATSYTDVHRNGQPLEPEELIKVNIERGLIKKPVPEWLEKFALPEATISPVKPPSGPQPRR